MTTPSKLRVFLCHASQDKSVVRELFRRLGSENWIDPWLDEEKLLPGQDWDLEIEKAVEASDAVVVCLSNRSVTKEGYVQKKLRKVLDIALEKPGGTIFIIPLRLDECELPRRLRAWHFVDYFPAERRDWASQRLVESLRLRSGNSPVGDKHQQNDPPIISENLTEVKEEISPPATEKARMNNLEIGWSIPLILYYLLTSLEAFTDSDDTTKFLLGTFAILSGVAMLVRKQIPETVLYKVSLILFLLVYGQGYRLEDIISFAPYIAGVAALISGGILVATVGMPKKSVFYSSISFAAFLFLVGIYEIATNFDYTSVTDTIYTMVVITSIITSVLLWRDL